MKLISQDGKYDVPYETAILECSHRIDYYNEAFSKMIIFAKYDTNVEVEYVMGLLHLAHDDGEQMFQFPSQEVVSGLMKRK